MKRPVEITGRPAGPREPGTEGTAALHTVYSDPKVTEFPSFTPRTIEQCEAIIAVAMSATEAALRQVCMRAVVGQSGVLVGAARPGSVSGEAPRPGAARADHWDVNRRPGGAK